MYLDDVLVYSKDAKQHVQDVKDVLEALRAVRLWLKPEKCYFYRTEVIFLGYVITTEGISIDPKKVAIVLKWNALTCVKDM
jgi:hypothetical protein